MTNGAKKPKSVSARSKRSRIGIFGGSFNPPHVGHIGIAERVRREFALDQVVFVPTFLPPHKETSTPFALRCRMVGLAIAARRYFELSRIERRLPRPSYTAKTIRYFRSRYPRADLFLIIGSDQFLELDTWYRPKALLEDCTLIVVMRPGCRVPARMKKMAGVRFSRMKPIDISSSRIRERVRRGRSLRALVPGSVERFIAEHRLYRIK